MRSSATVTVRSHPLWRMRLARRLPRLLVHALAIAGLLASARFAIAPPRPGLPAGAERSAPAPDLAAEGFASLFARAYLTWSAGDPEAHSRALERFSGSALESEAGMRPPQTGSERVLWEQVVQERRLGASERVYAIAADTEPGGLVYLAVPVLRQRGGALALAGYPAFVGPPTSTEAAPAVGEGEEVQDEALSTMIARALRNYLTPAPAELAADLTPGAKVSTPRLGLTLQGIQSLVWAPGGGAVIAVLAASDAGGAQYTLAYEVDVQRSAGRWEISAIEMDPSS